MVDDFASLHRVRACVRKHRVVERHTLIVRRGRAGRHYPTFRGSDYLHATIG